jgi:cardiolipin synthase
VRHVAPPPRAAEDLYCLHPDAVIAGHRVELLVDGATAYPAMLEAIAHASRDIYLETYIFAADKTGERFAEALAERALAGVSVRLVVDAVGSFDLSEPILRRLRSAGVQIAEFHPVAPWRARWGWSVRDHRKLLVVDSMIAFAGGLNIGDDYAPREWAGHAWHDVHVRLQGPCVREIEKQFLSTWRYAIGEQVTVRRATPAVLGPARVQVLASGSRRGRRDISRNYHFAMKRARERIYLQAAYCIPERGLRRVLRNAVGRGVDVRLMLPGLSDVRAVQYASRATYASLLKSGVKIYEWMPTVLHAKTLVVDGVWCSIGSYNLDQRSLRYNWELTVVVVDRPTGAALEQAFEADLASCVQVDPQQWARRDLWHRTLERLFYMLRRWL